MSLCPSSTRRIVSSLKEYADLEEHAGKKFTVDSPDVLQALEYHNTKWGNLQASKITDPHANLATEAISYAEQMTACAFMIGLSYC